MTTVIKRIKGSWEVVSEGWHVSKVPTVVNGFGRPVETSDLVIRTRIERRPIWEFVGYEERIVES